MVQSTCEGGALFFESTLVRMGAKISTLQCSTAIYIIFHNQFMEFLNYKSWCSHNVRTDTQTDSRHTDGHLANEYSQVMVNENSTF